jgi:hypothetical protein
LQIKVVFDVAQKGQYCAMTDKLIDVWNIDTFDAALLAELQAGEKVLRGYMITEKKNLLEYIECRTVGRWQPLKSNSHASAYQDFVERIIMPAMEKRTIRAWHYTRLTDAEAALLRTDGIYISTLETIRMRLDMQVSEGLLLAHAADALYAASPFHEQNDVRSNRFWMTSHPLPIDDGGVTLLLENWGGEGVYFWLQDVDLIELVKRIGRPRVIEVAIPLSATDQPYEAAKAVVATFGLTLGCEPEKEAFDLYSMQALGQETVLNIHTEGDPHFVALARGYPASFTRSPDD